MKLLKPLKLPFKPKVMVTKVALVVLIINPIFLQIFAQVPDSIQLTQLVVAAKKAEKIPALRSIELNEEILNSSNTLSLGEVLKKHSTVFIKDYGPSNIQTPTFRGMAATHTKIFVNGLSISPASLGQSDLNILPTYLFDGIGLKHGNSSFSEGPGAIGGGVMLKTNNQTRRNGHTGNLGLSYGSFGSFSAQGEYGFTKEKWQSITRYIFQKADNDFEFRNVAQKDYPYQTQEHSEKSLHGLMQAFKFSKHWRNSWKVMFLGTSTHRNLPALMTSTSPSKEKQSDQLFTTQVEWKRFIERGWSKLVLGYTWNTLHYEDTDAGINSTTLNQQYQIREDVVRELNEKWSLKAMGLLSYSTANNPNYIGTADMIQGSVLIGTKGNPSKKWEIGLYVQPTWNNSDFEMLPMASLAFKPLGHNRLTIGFNGSKNAHFPTLNDLYWVPGGNPELQPEISTTGEFNLHSEGYVLKSLEYELDGSVFLGIVDNWILWQPTDKNYWEAQNIKTVAHSGFDASFSLVKKYNIWKYKFQTGYQFVNAINKGVEDESLNKQLIYTPKHLLNWLVRADRKKLWLQANYSFTGTRYITTSNSAYLPAYDLIDFAAGYKTKINNSKWLLIQFNINNVLNKEYMSVVYRAMPGINYNLTVKYVLK